MDNSWAKFYSGFLSRSQNNHRDIPDDDDCTINQLTRDCAIIFNSKAIDSSEDDYSSGSTYFIKASEAPRCNLEKLAISIFHEHAPVGNFDPLASGAEWWSQVIEAEDDIGFHWDRDYGLEEDEGIHKYPYLGTVTYFSSFGSPTVVINHRGSSLADESITETSRQMVVSKPSIGSHLVFQGNLLHAAPSAILHPDLVSGSDGEGDSDGDSTDDDIGRREIDVSKLIEELAQKRVTFLVNIWLNHVPSQAARCEESIISKLSPTSSLQLIQSANRVVTVESCLKLSLTQESCNRMEKCSFNNTEVNYDVTVPLPDAIELDESFDKADRENGCGMILLQYSEDLGVSVEYCSEQDDDEDDDDEESDSEGTIVEEDTSVHSMSDNSVEKHRLKKKRIH